MPTEEFVTYPRPQPVVTASDEQMEVALAVRTLCARALLVDPVLLAAHAAVYPLVPKLPGGMSDAMAFYACATILVLIVSRSVGVWCTVTAMDLLTEGKKVRWRASHVVAAAYVVLPFVGAVVPLAMAVWAVGFLTKHGGKAWVARQRTAVAKTA